MSLITKNLFLMTSCSGNIYYKAMYTFVTACRRKKKVPQTKPLYSDEFSKIHTRFPTQWTFMDDFFFEIICDPPIKLHFILPDKRLSNIQKRAWEPISHVNILLCSLRRGTHQWFLHVVLTAMNKEINNKIHMANIPIFST